jgi:hypothetical protein
MTKNMLSLFDNQIQLDLENFPKLHLYHLERVEGFALQMMVTNGTPVTPGKTLSPDEIIKIESALAMLELDLEMMN